MEILILVEPTEGGRFVAQAGEPFSLSADGGTADDATQRLRALIDARLQGGGMLKLLSLADGKSGSPVGLPIPADDLYKTDWAFQALGEAIAENRRLEDAANL